MDSVLKDMDFLSKHWAAYTRRYPAQFPIGTVGSIASKVSWIRHPFQSCNFSLILRGRGEYHRAGVVWAVEAPCVITQWPGEMTNYGPLGDEPTWDELFLIYDASLFTAFEKCHLIDRRKPVWPIANIAGVHAQIDALNDLSRAEDLALVVDHVDRVCETLLLETWLAPPGVEVEPGEAAVFQVILTELDHDLGRDVDFDELALRYGMSPATFRRHWKKVIGKPPGRYRLEKRIREACRLLAETLRPVREISRMVGFDDELYFSRRFHREQGMPPRQYRRLYQIR